MIQEAAGGNQGQVQPSKKKWFLWVWLALTAILSLFAFWGLRLVPFHPDESTQLYMSADFDLLLHDPLAMAWSPSKSGSLPQHYRLVDAPLTKYILGLGRSLTGQAALAADWDWSMNWDQNFTRGALPEPGLLQSGRAALVFLIPLDLLLVCIIGMRMGGKITGLLAELLFGLNALVLLHDRRAMAEPALTFGVIFCVWSFLDGNRRPWLAGLAAAVASNAKQTGIFLLPVGLIAVVLPLAEDFQRSHAEKIRRTLWRAAQYGMVFFVITVALNPILWAHPFQAAQAAWAERQELSLRQLADFNRLSPETVLNSPARRFGTMLAHLFLVPPIFAETSNYLDDIRASETDYLAIGGHDLLRGMAVGGLLLIFTMFGLTLGIIRLFQTGFLRKSVLLIVILSTISLIIGIYTVVGFPWQRYLLPLVPFSCLWAAYGISAPFERKP